MIATITRVSAGVPGGGNGSLACAVAEAQPQATTNASIAKAMQDTIRTYVKFTFFKLSPEWQRRDTELRAQDKREFLAACEDFATDRSLRAYSTVGTSGDTDLLILSQSPILDDLHNFHVVLAQTGLAQWAAIPHSYLAMTKPSPYSDSEVRPEICVSAAQVPLRLPVREEARVVRAACRGA